MADRTLAEKLSDRTSPEVDKLLKEKRACLQRMARLNAKLKNAAEELNDIDQALYKLAEDLEVKEGALVEVPLTTTEE